MNALRRAEHRVKELQMRKLFYFTSILLITAGMTFAQAGGSSTGSTTGAGSSSGSSTGAAPGSDQGAAPSSSTPSDQTGSSATSTGTSSSDQTTISGCVSKSGNDFVLTDQNGTAYKLDGSGLDSQVGKQISATGSMGSDNKFKVSDMKPVSDSCSNAGASAAPSAAAAPATSASSDSNPPSSPNSTAPVTDSGLKSNNAPVPSANDNAAAPSGAQPTATTDSTASGSGGAMQA